MGGKSGGTHRIQYSSGTPPPIGVMRTTIASSAGIVTVVSTIGSTHRPDSGGGAGHAAHVHRQLVGRHAMAVRDVVVLEGANAGNTSPALTVELAGQPTAAHTAERVDDDVCALGRGHADPSAVGKGHDHEVCDVDAAARS